MNKLFASRGRRIEGVIAIVANLFSIIAFVSQTKLQPQQIFINPFFWFSIIITITYVFMIAHYRRIDYKRSLEDRLKEQEEKTNRLLKEQEDKFLVLLKEKDTSIDLLRKNVNENMKVLFDNFTTSFKRHNELVWKIQAEKEAKNTLQKSELAKYYADIQRLINLYEPKGMGIELRSRS